MTHDSWACSNTARVVAHGVGSAPGSLNRSSSSVTGSCMDMVFPFFDSAKDAERCLWTPFGNHSNDFQRGARRQHSEEPSATTPQQHRDLSISQLTSTPGLERPLRRAP